METNTTSKVPLATDAAEGHEVTAETPATQPATEQDTETPQPEPKFKMPIFIGCVDKTQVDAILKVVDQDKFQVAMLGEDVLRASTQNWIYSMLSKEEKARQDSVQKEERYRKSAMDYANELKDYYLNAKALEAVNAFEPQYPQTGRGKKKQMDERDFNEYKKLTDAVHYFTVAELKNYFNHWRAALTKGKKRCVGLSNKDAENIMDLLMSFGYATQVDVGIPKHKVRFAVTIDDSSRLHYLQNIHDQLKKKEAELLDDIQIITTEQQELSAKLLSEAAKELPDEIKKDNEATGDDEGAEPPTATDALNDK
jgi:hypothetical protein